MILDRSTPPAPGQWWLTKACHPRQVIGVHRDLVHWRYCCKFRRAVSEVMSTLAEWEQWASAERAIVVVDEVADARWRTATHGELEHRTSELAATFKSTTA